MQTQFAGLSNPCPIRRCGLHKTFILDQPEAGPAACCGLACPAAMRADLAGINKCVFGRLDGPESLKTSAKTC